MKETRPHRAARVRPAPPQRPLAPGRTALGTPPPARNPPDPRADRAPGGRGPGELRRRDRGGLQRRARPRQRGTHHQGPGEPLHARPARVGVAQAQEGTGHARRGGRRRGVGPRQAQQRAQRLHVRRARREHGGTQDHRQGVLRPDGRGNPRTDDPFPAEASSPRAASTTRSSRTWCWKSRSTRSSPARGTRAGCRCVSRASKRSGATRRRARSTRWRTRGRSPCRPSRRRDRGGRDRPETCPHPLLRKAAQLFDASGVDHAREEDTLPTAPSS